MADVLSASLYRRIVCGVMRLKPLHSTSLSHVPSASLVPFAFDPLLSLDPLLFCLTIYPLVRSQSSGFKDFFLDDGTLNGPMDKALNDFHLVDSMASTLGLQLNHSKSELICADLRSYAMWSSWFESCE